jgi:hypothetical protein
MSHGRLLLLFIRTLLLLQQGYPRCGRLPTDPLVTVKRIVSHKAKSTTVACVRLLACVQSQMSLTIMASCERK